MRLNLDYTNPYKLPQHIKPNTFSLVTPHTTTRGVKPIIWLTSEVLHTDVLLTKPISITGHLKYSFAYSSSSGLVGVVLHACASLLEWKPDMLKVVTPEPDLNSTSVKRYTPVFILEPQGLLVFKSNSVIVIPTNLEVLQVLY